MVIEIIFVLAGISYAMLIGWFTAGWLRLPVFWPKGNGSARLSVIIALRNEERNIVKLMESLRWQKYPAEHFEVLIIDDHSTDSTPDLVAQRLASGMYSNFRLIGASDFIEIQGKKNAITLGVRHSQFEWVVTTDADCIMGRHWLQSISDFIESQNPNMVIGQVIIEHRNSLFSQMQALEFMSLSGATAGSAAIGRPIMCNGANLAFRKDLFEKTGGYQGNEHYASGDDMFLLLKFKKLPDAHIAFLKSHGALVYTRATASLKEFFNQRARWAGKASGYRDGFTLATGLVVSATNLLIVAGTIAGLFLSGKYLLAALLLLIFKAAVDLPILYNITGFLRKRELMWLYPALFLVYPFYVIISLGLGLFAKPKWKN